ncbi:MAG: hypothetical protein ACOY4H_14870 [Thermodesulfobacteriota bacterium]
MRRAFSPLQAVEIGKLSIRASILKEKFYKEFARLIEDVLLGCVLEMRSLKGFDNVFAFH